MTPIEQLRIEAKQKRDKAIAKARNEYRRTIIELDRLGRRINGTNKRSRYTASLRGDGSSYESMTTIRAAELVLRDCGPMRLVELTVEVMQRGCRRHDDPRRVQRAILGSLRYQAGRFVFDGERWAVLR